MAGPGRVHELEPVREFTGDTRVLGVSVHRALVEQRAKLIEEIGTIECKTFDEYRNRRGRIEGLDIAIQICKEIQRKLEA
jgi:hypothetical protein